VKILPALIITGSICLAFAQPRDVTPSKRQRTDDNPMQRAPDSARARRNPFEGKAVEAAAGGKLFQQHCAECHGPKAGGTTRAPGLFRGEVREAPPGALFWVLTNGVVRHGMPVWSKLPEQQRWQIVTFLEALNKNAPAAASH